MSLSRHLPDGSCWPSPGAELDDLEDRLRYDRGGTSTSNRLAAASVVGAYRVLIETGSRRRAEVVVVRLLKAQP